MTHDRFQVSQTQFGGGDWTKRPYKEDRIFQKAWQNNYLAKGAHILFCINGRIQV